MKILRQKTLWYGLATFALLAAIVALFTYHSEPRYQGRTLTAWLQDYTRSHTRQSAAQTAIRAIGTNASPTLVKMLLPVDRTFSLARLFKKNNIPIELVQDSDRTPNHHLAMHGFHILGPTASNAIPLLLPHLQDQHTAHFVADAIQTIGPPALSSVQPLLNSTNTVTKIHAVHIILGITRRDPTTVSNLLRHHDHIIRGETYLWLNARHLPSDYILSTLRNGLKDPHTYVAQRALLGIRSLELRYATNALPHLYQLRQTQSTNALFAQEIAAAIKNIEKRVRIENSDPVTPRR